MLDSFLEDGFAGLLQMAETKGMSTADIILRKLLKQSRVLVEVDRSLRLLSQRHLDRMLLERPRGSWLSLGLGSLRGAWRKFREDLQGKAEAPETRLAMLDFDVDFLLDLMLFRAKWSVCAFHRNPESSEQVRGVYTLQLFPLSTDDADFHMAMQTDIKGLEPVRLKMRPDPLLKENWELCMFRLALHEKAKSLRRDADVLDREDPDMLRWTFKLVKILEILRANQRIKMVVSAHDIQMVDRLLKLVESQLNK